ncbi:MAG: shikimate dehydrogenase, partial [Smithellaceae bacterium]|nr:shikimate dehydrogenase [Smithellaceae bacterium]
MMHRHPEIFALFGNPVRHSLSPLMHNTTLARMGIDGRYIPFCIHDLPSAVRGIRDLGIKGVSITIPFKVEVMEHLDEIDFDALKIGAVNTIMNTDGRLTGYNTDWQGMVLALREAMDIKGRDFVILGAGGTAKAAAFGIIKEGGRAIIVNRTLERGMQLACDLGCPFFRIQDIGRIDGDCLINTTPVGMWPHTDVSPVPAEVLQNFRWVMDVIYTPMKTKLIKDADAYGRITIPGMGMFVHQGAEQLRLWTGKEPPRAFMMRVVHERLEEKEG